MCCAVLFLVLLYLALSYLSCFSRGILFRQKKGGREKEKKARDWKNENENETITIQQNKAAKPTSSIKKILGFAKRTIV